MTPSDYKPQFDQTVREYIHGYEDTTTTEINPMYCLLGPSAKLLAFLLPQYKPTIYQDTPWQTFRWSFNHTVPWIALTLPDGTEKSYNAALLAYYYTMGGVTPERAFGYIIDDIEGRLG
jgi:hypothetical protein